MKLLLIVTMMVLLLFVTGCEPGGAEVLSDYERNNNNIERYERLLDSDELSATERRTVKWYLDAAKEWRDNYEDA